MKVWRTRLYLEKKFSNYNLLEACDFQKTLFTDLLTSVHLLKSQFGT